ncbi:hypothetical protein CDAR_208491 [Caerostris darwini]|uniref:Uncharacterized protein n=1 Tax=Caerostris darwini TaxID=1538125 RepID=A0AAV4W5E7_9ARAC|nr:hypothetical protein CDAR_208491 [Caerostris darwini]
MKYLLINIKIRESRSLRKEKFNLDTLSLCGSLNESLPIHCFQYRLHPTVLTAIYAQQKQRGFYLPVMRHKSEHPSPSIPFINPFQARGRCSGLSYSPWKNFARQPLNLCL